MTDIKLQAQARHLPTQHSAIAADTARVALASSVKRKQEDEAMEVAVDSEARSETTTPAEAAAGASEAGIPASAESVGVIGGGSNVLPIAGGLGLLGIAAAAVGGGGGGGGGSGAAVVPPAQQHQTEVLPQTRVPTGPGEPKAQIPKPDMSKPDTPQVDVQHVDLPPTEATKPEATAPVVTPPEATPTDQPNSESKLTDPVVVPTIPAPDTTPPVAPTLSLKNDTGADATDGITSDSRITVSGLEQDATWRYSVDGGKTWHAGSGGEISMSMFDGQRDVQVIQTDAAGNDSEMASLHFTLDTGAPTLALKNDSAGGHYAHSGAGRWVVDEALKHDGITNDGTVVVDGLHEGLVWTYSLDEGKTWKNGSGTEIAASEMGEDGRKTVWTKQLTASMTESGISAFSFVLDTQVGNITPRLKAADSMSAEGTPQTSRPVAVFDGYEAGATVLVTVFGGDFGSRPETVIGGELPLDLQPGSYRISEIIQTDVAGNSSGYGQSGALEFIVPPPVLP